MRTLIPVTIAVSFALLGCAKSSQPEASGAGDEDVIADSLVASAALDAREEFLKKNIEFQLRDRLNGRSITMGPVNDSEMEGLDRGSFTVGPETYYFLTTKDDKTVIFLAMEPFKSLSDDEMAATLEEEAAEAKRQEEERSRDLALAAKKAPMRGNPDAPVTIIEFSDFECPYCRRGFDTVKQLLEKHGDDVRFVYLHFPLSFHPWAKSSAVASVCAAEQDQDAFWTLHDYYFQNQDDIEVANVVEKSKAALGGANLDLDRWEVCAADTSSSAHKEALAVVQTQADLGRDSGVTGTPGFFVNGKFISGAQPLQTFEAAIDEARR